MGGSRFTVTLKEFKLFHGIDRSLYVILIRDLLRDPLECLYILGLWLCSLSHLSPSRGKGKATNEVSRNERTMFVTFSKGYPVNEYEVKLFFERVFGNCIESFHMQEVSNPEEQSLYAKIVFLRPAFIRAILNGAMKAKFTINGKHVWMRKFVPKNNRHSPSGSPSVGSPSVGPSHSFF
ncbi:uncharacterized protein LOC125193512 [Salvia hispanica]|uniref:uncharacterized protein LOC125193512 n=1 Tax=Salvia hispanica TaxID=49212 RepID=UPI0020096850|nr:uncharacterized protein LOC125193512 [Salvia hispanica]